MNLTKEELMKAILCCITNDCTDCPLSNRHCSELLVLELARNFILKQEEELKICNEALDNSVKLNANLHKEWKSSKIEAYKEFAYDLTKEIYKGGIYPSIVEEEFICKIEALLREKLNNIQ